MCESESVIKSRSDVWYVCESEKECVCVRACVKVCNVCESKSVCENVC